LPEQPQLELLRPAEQAQQQMERHQVPPGPEPTV
jgi:hypothetical protein